MKNIVLFIALIILTFSNCSKDDSLNYKVPKFSIEDYYNMLGTTRDQFLKKYPYALHEYSEIINSYLKGDPEYKIIITYFYFNEDYLCEHISFYEYSNKEILERCYILADIISKFSSYIESIILSTINNDQSENIEFNNIEELKSWINTNPIGNNTVISFKWTSPDYNVDNSNNYNIDLRYIASFHENGSNSWRINFNISN
jgi:hypothetical protein